MTEASGSKWKLLAGLSLLAAVMAFAVAVWFVFSADGTRVTSQTEAIPVVRAPSGPDRERPANRGGAEIPDQDKEVYETFRAASERSEERIERLLPAGEEPMADPEPQPAPVPVAEAESGAADTASPADDVQPTETTIIEEQVARADPAPIPAPPPAPKAASRAAPKPAPEPVPEVAVKSVKPTGSWQVQLAALRDKDAAMQTWKRIAAKQTALLSGMSPTVSRTDTGAKGVFFRLRTGDFKTKAAAAGFCDRLKKAGQDCLVAKVQ